jgi:hypothetical protein
MGSRSLSVSVRTQTSRETFAALAAQELPRGQRDLFNFHCFVAKFFKHPLAASHSQHPRLSLMPESLSVPNATYKPSVCLLHLQVDGY